MTDTHPGRSATLFLQLVLGLQQSGMMALGKLMNPLSRKIETDLEMARDTIDTLAGIEARTRGNLEADEARVLRQALTDLRMNYLDAVKKAAVPSAAAAEPSNASTTPAGPSATNATPAEPNATSAAPGDPGAAGAGA